MKASVAKKIKRVPGTSTLLQTALDSFVSFLRDCCPWYGKPFGIPSSARIVTKAPIGMLSPIYQIGNVSSGPKTTYLNQKIQRQVDRSLMMPPRIGPKTRAMITARPFFATASAYLVGGFDSMSKIAPNAKQPPPPTP